jgi:hypothetical protein
MTLHITTAPCTNVLSGSQWKTPTGTGLRLRVDSTRALQGASFTLPKAMLPKLTDAGKGAVGSVVLYLAGGAKTNLNLAIRKGDKTGTLFASAVGSPRIQLTKRGVTVSGLPAKVGVIEITLFTRNATSPKALLQKGQKAKLAALVTPVGKPAVKLNTVIAAQRH